MTHKICGEHAAFRYTWPGRDESFICVEHAATLQNVAQHMGLYVQLIPLSVKVGDPIVTEWPTCAQKVEVKNG
jgi:hypothetical protein